MKSINKIFLGLALTACLGFAGCGDTTDAGKGTTPPAAGGGAENDGSGAKDGAKDGHERRGYG